jgi:DNA polymerase
MNSADPAGAAALLAALRWQLEMGADEAVELTPRTITLPQRSQVTHAGLTAVVHAGAPDSCPSSQLPSDKTSPIIQNRTSTPDLSTIQDLDALRKALMAFDACSLPKTATGLVFGEGPANADVMLIGDAPGVEEDRAGRPFVGPRGQLLDRMLGSIGLTRQQVYITNIVPWRPPGDRTPTDREIALCLPYCQRHIGLIAPQLIVPLGGASATALSGRAEGITRLRGRWFTVTDQAALAAVPMLPMFHPAYLLRNSAAKREAWRDLLTLREKLDAVT